MSWPTKKLGELISFEKGKKMIISDDGDPYIGIENLRSGTYSNYTKENHGARCRQDDVLLVWDGAYAGTVGMGLEGFVGSTIVKVLHRNSLNNSFLFYLLNLYRNKIRSAAQGAAIPHLSKVFISNLKISLPSLQIQKQIVERLDKIAEAQKLNDELIQKANELYRSLRNNVVNVKMKKQKWPMVRFGDILDYEQPGKYIVQTKICKEKTEDCVSVLTANKAFILGYTKEKEGIYRDIPVIIFDDFTTDKKFVDFPFKVKSSAMKILKLKTKNANLRFIFETMEKIKFDHETHKRYYLSEYQHIKITFPSLKIQKQIVAKLSAVYDYKKQLLEQKSKLKELFDSVLNKSMK